MSDQLFPLPEITPLSRPHWEGLAQQKFLIQRCTQCGTLRHYPRVICSACYSPEYSWLEASRKANVHSWTTTHHAYHPAFKSEVPYVVVTADLPEGVRMLARFQGPSETVFRIDLPMRIGFLRLNDEITLPTLIAD